VFQVLIPCDAQFGNCDSANRVERGAAMLSEIIKPLFAIRYSEHFGGDGAVFFGAAVQHGVEGIVSKRTANR